MNISDVTVSRKHLLSALRAAKRVVGKGKGVYGQCRLEFDNGALYLARVGDSITGTRFHQRVFDIPHDGAAVSAVVDAESLLGVVSKVSGELVVLDVVGLTGELRVRSGSTAVSLQLQNDDAVVWSGLDGFGAATSVPADELLRALDSIGYAVATGAFQAVFRSVLFESGRMVATDGFRLAYAEVPALVGIESFLIRGKALVGMRQVLKSAKDLFVRIRPQQDRTEARADGLTVKHPGEWVEFAIGKSTVHFCRGIGTFPDYRRVMPNGEFPVRAFVNPTILREAVERVHAFSDKLANHRVDIRFGNDSMFALSAEGPIGRADEKVEASYSVSLSLPLESCAFNGKYLMEALGTMSGREATIDFSGSTSIAVMGGYDGVTHLLVPLRTG